MLEGPHTPGRVISYLLEQGAVGHLSGIQYAARVTRGIAHLDEVAEGWWRTDQVNAIDLDFLDIGNDEWCVSAQLSGEHDYLSGADLLGLTQTTVDFVGEVTRGTYLLYGFVADPPGDLGAGYRRSDAYTVLTNLWRNAIRVRRGEPIDLAA